MLNMTNDTSPKHYCDNGKRIFSMKDAHITANRILMTKGKRQRPYLCELGNHYHLTSLEVDTKDWMKKRSIIPMKKKRYDEYEDY